MCDEQEILETLSSRIKEAREGTASKETGRKMSQEEVAAALGKDRNTVSRWEDPLNEKSVPDVKDIIKMCELFGCDSGYFFGEYEGRTRIATDIQAEIGLSEAAIENLSSVNLRNDAMWQMDYLNYFFEDDDFNYFISVLTDYIDTLQTNPDKVVADRIGSASRQTIKAADMLLYTLQSSFGDIVKRVRNRHKADMRQGKEDYRYYYRALLDIYLGGIACVDSNKHEKIVSLAREEYNEMQKKLHLCTTNEQREAVIYGEAYEIVGARRKQFEGGEI